MLQYWEPFISDKRKKKNRIRRSQQEEWIPASCQSKENWDQTEQYLKINCAFLYFIFISFKESKASRMNTASRTYFYPPNAYSTPQNYKMPNHALLTVLSEALSRSVGEYGVVRMKEKKEIDDRKVIQIMDSENQDENIMGEERVVVDNVKNIHEENEKTSLKKDQSSHQHGQKEQSYTIMPETIQKNLSAVKNQKQLFPQFELTPATIDATQILPMHLPKEEIERKKVNLLARKVQLGSNNSKKIKYHGLGTQKRELKQLS